MNQIPEILLSEEHKNWLEAHKKTMDLIKKEAASGFTFGLNDNGNLSIKDHKERGHEGCIGVVDDSEVFRAEKAINDEAVAQMQNVKGVQTLWGGFLEHKDQCPEMWKLSLHFLRKLCNRVELYADDGGKEFARAAGLNYDAVHTLPKAKGGLEKVWSAGKLMAMEKQDCPFLHVDGDAFIREPFMLPPFIVQNDEPWLYESEPYKQRYYACWERFPNHPTTKRPLVSYCFGLVGGTAYKEIAAACSDSLKFMNDNAEAIIELSNRVDRGDVLASVLLEQIWVPIFVEKRGIKISTYLKGSQAHFDAITKKYFHAMGGKMSDLVLSEVKELAGKLLS